MIPKLIHQTLRDKNDIHHAIAANIGRLKTLNPGWEHLLYDDSDCEEFIKAEYGLSTLRLYSRISRRYGAARADYFRYLLMYKRGGVYLDIKSTCTRSLDEILQPDDQFLLSTWNNAPGQRYHGFGNHAELAHTRNGGEYQQWHIICAPEHPYLAKVIERVERNIAAYSPAKQGVGAMAVLRVTGPIAYTLAIEEVVDAYPHRVIDAEALGLVYSVYDDPTDPLAHRKIITPYSNKKTPVIRPEGLQSILSYLQLILAAFFRRMDKFLRKSQDVRASKGQASAE